MDEISLHKLREQGAVLVKGFMPRDLLKLACKRSNLAIERWYDGHRCDDYWQFESDSGTVLYRIHNLQNVDAFFYRLAYASFMIDAASKVLEDEAKPTVTALIYKQPHCGASVPWHRDPVDVPPQTVYNFSLFLDRSTSENGALAYVPGSHLDEEIEEGEGCGKVVLEADPGDLIIHDVRVYHGSSSSLSPDQRRSIVTEYRAGQMFGGTYLSV